MPKELFAVRLRTIRETWDERRALIHAGTTRNFDSQFLLLREMHEWATEAVRDIREVYGRRFPISLGPAPDRDEFPPAFHVAIGEGQALMVSLREQRFGLESNWGVVMSMHGQEIPHGSHPRVRPGTWTRADLEDVLLSMLGSFERSRS